MDVGRQNSTERKMDPESLRQELERLKKEKAVYQAQSRLLDHFVSVARASDDKSMLTQTLQKSLDVSIGLTGAEKGSLFLLDTEGAVIESILTRGKASSVERNRLIGTVLDQGLAGWVRRQCQLDSGDCKAAYIRDTEKDDRWVTLPEQPYKVRSALAVPISRKSQLLGLLTLLHSQPEHFSSESIDLIMMTADQIAVILENATLYKELDDSFHRIEQAKLEVEAYSRALDSELEKGRRMQRDFLPEKIPQPPEWEIAAYLHPAIQVSGDFYDVLQLPDGNLGLVVADVCDKGVGAALFMALFRSLIRVFTFRSGRVEGLSVPKSAGRRLNVLSAVHETNSYIARHHGKMGMFATMFVGMLDVSSGKLAYINAGHEPPIILKRSGQPLLLWPTGPAVGLMPDMIFNTDQVQMDAGEMLIVYTDGVTEASSAADEIFGRKRLHLILENKFLTVSEIIVRIKDDIFEHIGQAPQSDDITLMGVRRKEKPK
jgi:sigma-B regulation protein RsbU (phosphoserine phosphatase)